MIPTRACSLNRSQLPETNSPLWQHLSCITGSIPLAAKASLWKKQNNGSKSRFCALSIILLMFSSQSGCAISCYSNTLVPHQAYWTWVQWKCPPQLQLPSHTCFTRTGETAPFVCHLESSICAAWPSPAFIRVVVCCCMSSSDIWWIRPGTVVWFSIYPQQTDPGPV